MEELKSALAMLTQLFREHERKDDQTFASLDGKLDKILTQTTSTTNRVSEIETNAKIRAALDKQDRAHIAEDLKAVTAKRENRSSWQKVLVPTVLTVTVAILIMLVDLVAHLH